MANEFTFAEDNAERPVTMFGPDFPFAFDDWIAHPAGLGSIPQERHGEEVAIVGAGMSGMVAAYELMKLGLRPVIYEASHMGGRLRSQEFEGAPRGVIAELGGMRFPVSSTAFYHYVDLLGLPTAPFPNPLTRASNSTVIHIEGKTHYAEHPDTLPALFQEVAQAWADALEGVGFTKIQDAIRARDVAGLKSLWNKLVPIWDDRTFYDFLASSEAFSKLSFHTVRCLVKSDSGLGLGLRFPELDAGDLPRRDDQLRRKPAPHSRRRRAGAAWPVGARAVEAYSLAGGHQPGIAALWRHQAGCSSNKPRRQ